MPKPAAVTSDDDLVVDLCKAVLDLHRRDPVAARALVVLLTRRVHKK